MSATTIFVTFQVPGLHYWPKPTPHRSYLGFLHRHQFHVRVEMAVTHDDREVEFHDLIDEARSRFVDLSDGNGDFGHQSCEMMAAALANGLAEWYARAVTVTVSEDGEAGAVVTVLRRLSSPAPRS